MLMKSHVPGFIICSLNILYYIIFLKSPNEYFYLCTLKEKIYIIENT